MLFRVNILSIVSDHLSTLRDYRPNEEPVPKPDANAWLVFVIFPILIGITLVIVDLRLYSDHLEILQAALVVFAGLMLNVLVLLFNAARDGKLVGIALTTLQQTYHNIAYLILASLLFVAASFTAQLIIQQVGLPSANRLVSSIGSGVGFSILIHFLLTFLMIMKRVHKLLGEALPSSKAQA